MIRKDPDLDFLPIPDSGSSGQKGTGSRIRSTDFRQCCAFEFNEEGQDSSLSRINPKKAFK